MPNANGYVFLNQKYELTLDTGIDLSTETGNVKLKIRKPDDTDTEVTPSIVEPPSSGLLLYEFPIDYLNQLGTWQIQGYLVTQQMPGRIFYLEILPAVGKSLIPSAQEIRDLLEGYGITETILSDEWIIKRRDRFIIPWIERKTRQKLTGTDQVIEYHSGTGTTILILNRRPITSIDKIEYVIGGGDFALRLSQVELVQEEGIIKAKRIFEEESYPIFPRGKYNIKITMTVGFSSIPDDVYEAVMCLTAEAMLGHIGSRTGGGSLSVQGYGRSFGSRGKYTDARNDLARQGISLLRRYMTGVIGG